MRIAKNLKVAADSGFLDGAEDPNAPLLAAAIALFRGQVLDY